MTSNDNLVPVDFDPFAGQSQRRVVPTTEAQREIWTIAAANDRASRVFNIPLRIGLRGALDPARLGQALARTVERHDVLGGCISPDGTTMELIQRGSQELDVLDLSVYEEEVR